MTELIFFEKEVNQIVNSIDFNRVKKDFEEATPRYWGSLLSISMLNQYGTSTFSKDFVDALNLNKVVSNIEKHYEVNLHEFRVIMYQLSYGSDSTKKEYAKALQPMVEQVMQRFTEKEDHEDILQAFYNLDNELGKESCKKLNKAVPNTRKKIKKPSDKKKSKLGIAAAEKSGEDYVMIENLISLKKEEPKQEA
ncbi:hypothetical protein [Flavobacterium sp. SM2513]|uniref:hypothetical protein n=1 Tax=Flavobacterium sp. SM2513 TaxID=3424766 RepID=UPI003D7FA03A